MQVRTVQFTQEVALTGPGHTLREKMLHIKTQIHTLRNQEGNTGKIKILKQKYKSTEAKIIRHNYPLTQELEKELFTEDFNIGESYLSSPWNMRQKSNGNTFATMDYTKTGCHLCGQYISLRNGERIHRDRQTNWRKQKRKYKN